MFISIIIPIFNSQKNLPNLLDNIFRQGFKDFELICIDDGSNDDSLHILNKYKCVDNRLFIIEQSNHGPAYARNVGIKQSKGEYLSFIDSDDIIDIDYYDKLTKYENYDIIRSNHVEVKDGKFINVKRSESINANIINEIRESQVPINSFVTGWQGTLFSNKLIKKFNITFPNSRRKEDIAFLRKILYVSSSFKNVDNCNYYYNIVNNSLSKGKDSVDIVKDHFISYFDVVQFINKNKIDYLKFLYCFLYEVNHFIQCYTNSFNFINLDKKYFDSIFLNSVDLYNTNNINDFNVRHYEFDDQTYLNLVDETKTKINYKISYAKNKFNIE